MWSLCLPVMNMVMKDLPVHISLDAMIGNQGKSPVPLMRGGAFFIFL